MWNERAAEREEDRNCITREVRFYKWARTGVSDHQTVDQQEKDHRAHKVLERRTPMRTHTPPPMLSEGLFFPRASHCGSFFCLSWWKQQEESVCACAQACSQNLPHAHAWEKPHTCASQKKVCNPLHTGPRIPGGKNNKPPDWKGGKVGGHWARTWENNFVSGRREVGCLKDKI